MKENQGKIQNLPGIDRFLWPFLLTMGPESSERLSFSGGEESRAPPMRQNKTHKNNKKLKHIYVK